jgi:hypothetical protein
MKRCRAEGAERFAFFVAARGARQQSHDHRRTVDQTLQTPTQSSLLIPAGVAPLWNKSRAAQHADYYNCTWQVPTRIKNNARSAGKFRRIAVKMRRFHRHL